MTRPLDAPQTAFPATERLLRSTLSDADTDPHPEGFATQIHCGRVDPCGRAAHALLSRELEFPGRVPGRVPERDLLGAATAGEPDRP